MDAVYESREFYGCFSISVFIFGNDKFVCFHKNSSSYEETCVKYTCDSLKVIESELESFVVETRQT